MHKSGGELPKSLISPWLLEFTGVKVGLMFDWDVGIVVPFLQIILDSIFESIGGAPLESRCFESIWLFESVEEMVSQMLSYRLQCLYKQHVIDHCASENVLGIVD